MMWLVPVCLFPLIAALYLGGHSLVTDRTSPPRELLGLTITFAVFFVIWMLAQRGFAAVLPAGASAGIACALCMFLFPFFAKGGFRLAGLHLHAAAETH